MMHGEGSERAGAVAARIVLGTALRRLRRDAGLSADQASAATGVAAELITGLECGQADVGFWDVAGLFSAYGVSDVATRTMLLGLAHRSHCREWWHAYRDVIPLWLEQYVALEQAASLIRCYSARTVPALLQVPGYARAAIAHQRPGAPEREVERRVELRMRRRRVLHGPAPARLWAVIDEAALRRQVCARLVMREQLLHLIAVCEMPGVTIQVLPFSASGHPAVIGGLLEPIGLAGRSDQIGTPKEESLVMLTLWRVDCIYPAPLVSLSLRGITRICDNLIANNQPTDDRRFPLYSLSSTAISEILGGKRKGLPTFGWVASYVLSCLWHAAAQRPDGRDQRTTVLPYWENIYAAHAADAAADAAKGGARTPAGLKDAPDGAARRTAYELPRHLQEFLLTHGPYAKTLIARAQLGHPHARYRVALLMATDPKLADDANALLIDVVNSGHPLALDLLDAVHEATALAGGDPAAVCPLSQVAAQFALDLGRAAWDHGADQHAFAFFRAAARVRNPDALLKLSQMQLKKFDPELAEWLGQLGTETAVGRHRTEELACLYSSRFSLDR